MRVKQPCETQFIPKFYLTVPGVDCVQAIAHHGKLQWPSHMVESWVNTNLQYGQVHCVITRMGKKFDVVLVWKFDRFCRSLPQLVSALELFKALSIDFVSRTEAVDTTLPIGQFVFHVFGAIAQFERELIRERTIAGLRAARKRGRKLGRPTVPPLLPEQVESIRKERAESKVSLRTLSRQHGIPLWRIHSICREAKPSV
jgi:hypothetical protein